jgi:Protein of unknown function (DUF998)
MNQSKSYIFGILGVFFFVFTTIIAGFLYPNYSHIAQFISESYATDATYNVPLRYYGFIPSGIFFILFSFYANKTLPKSGLKTLGFLGVGFGYGFGTIICSVFNCDAGCNPQFINPSVSQIIHNLAGMVTYLIVPISILFIGIATFKSKNNLSLSKISIITAIISFLLMIILNSNLDSIYKGLIQRIIESSILIWIIYTANASKKSYQQL